MTSSLAESRMEQDQRSVAVLFCCLRCSTVYRAIQYRRSTEGQGSYTCTVCSAVVRSWSGMYDLKDWEAVNVSDEYGSQGTNPRGTRKARSNSQPGGFSRRRPRGRKR